MIDIEYIMNVKGEPKAVVIPIGIWNQIFLRDDFTIEELKESIEDYCLKNAMDIGKKSELLNREEALKFLED